jgi:hypothetical protein
VIHYLDQTWMNLKALLLEDQTIGVKVVQIIPGHKTDNLFIDLMYRLRVV